MKAIDAWHDLVKGKLTTVKPSISGGKFKRGHTRKVKGKSGDVARDMLGGREKSGNVSVKDQWGNDIQVESVEATIRDMTKRGAEQTPERMKVIKNLLQWRHDNPSVAQHGETLNEDQLQKLYKEHGVSGGKTVSDRIAGLKSAIEKLEEKRRDATDRGVKTGLGRSINMKKNELGIAEMADPQAKLKEAKGSRDQAEIEKKKLQTSKKDAKSNIKSMKPRGELFGEEKKEEPEQGSLFMKKAMMDPHSQRLWQQAVDQATAQGQGANIVLIEQIFRSMGGQMKSSMDMLFDLFKAVDLKSDGKVERPAKVDTIHYDHNGVPYQKQADGSWKKLNQEEKKSKLGKAIGGWNDLVKGPPGLVARMVNVEGSNKLAKRWVKPGEQEPTFRAPKNPYGKSEKSDPKMRGKALMNFDSSVIEKMYEAVSEFTNDVKTGRTSGGRVAKFIHDLLVNTGAMKDDDWGDWSRGLAAGVWQYGGGAAAKAIMELEDAMLKAGMMRWYDKKAGKYRYHTEEQKSAKKKKKAEKKKVSPVVLGPGAWAERLMKIDDISRPPGVFKRGW